MANSWPKGSVRAPGPSASTPATPPAEGPTSTWTRSSGRASARLVTRSRSPSLDGSRGPLDRRLEPNGGLTHADARRLQLEPVQQRFRRGGGHRLEQLELPRLEDLAHARDDLAVVDGVLEAVRHRGVRNLEPQVIDEGLRIPALVLFDTVGADELEAGELDEDAHGATTARAAVNASTCSRTSWTRKIEAPRS